MFSRIFQARKLDENGNPSSSSNCCASNGSNVSFATRQLKPLSIYRHNPAFHSQHVSVNQNDEIPSLSPTSLQPTTPLTCASSKCEDAKSIPAKARRKKKVNLINIDEGVLIEKTDVSKESKRVKLSTISVRSTKKTKYMSIHYVK